MNNDKEKKERVNHPSYYKRGDVETIDYVRYYVFDIGNAMKYLSRAGLKDEDGMSLREKEVEDCEKAIWYLKDYMRRGSTLQAIPLPPHAKHPSGLDCEDVAEYYCDDIAHAIRELWWVGLVVNGCVVRPRCEMTNVWMAIESIKRRIDDITKTNAA